MVAKVTAVRYLCFLSDLPISLCFPTGKRSLAPATCLWAHHISDIPPQLSSNFLHFQSLSFFFFLVALFLVPSCLTLYIHHHTVYFWFSLPKGGGVLSSLVILNLPVNECALIKERYSELFGLLSLFLLIRVFVKVVEGQFGAWTFVICVQKVLNWSSSYDSRNHIVKGLCRFGCHAKHIFATVGSFSS